MHVKNEYAQYHVVIIGTSVKMCIKFNRNTGDRARI